MPTVVRIALCLLLAVAPSGLARAGAADAPPEEPARIIVANAVLIAREAEQPDTVVSLVITDGLLEVITQDPAEPEEGTQVFDASGGFILGKLVVGEPASFMVLDGDPRANVEVLLDTAQHILVAFHRGVMLKNALVEVEPRPEEEVKAKRATWTAYSAPPIALPLAYYKGRKWNVFKTRYVSGLFTGAVVLDRTRWLSQDNASEQQQVGDLSQSDGGEIRGLRFGLAGLFHFKRPWSYVLFGATNSFGKGFDTTTTDDVSWFDYRVDIPLPAKLSLSVGKQKEPISLERLTSMVFLPWQERSAPADTFYPSRNHGVVLSRAGSGGRHTWAFGVFNNWIDLDTSYSDSPTQLVGRATWLPWVSEDGTNTVHLGVGLRRGDAKLGVAYSTEPEFNQSPTFIDTGTLPADSALTYNLEAYWRKGPYWFGYEYTAVDVDSPSIGNPRFDGHMISGSWVITGEVRSYRARSGLFDPIRVAKPVTQGGWGTFEVAMRYSTTDLTEGIVQGGELDVYSVGGNWWLSQDAQFGINYRYQELDRFGVEGSSSGINTRILLILD